MMAKQIQSIRPMTKERFEELQFWAKNVQTGKVGDYVREIFYELERQQFLCKIHRSFYQVGVRQCQAHYRNSDTLRGGDRILEPPRCQRPDNHDGMHGVILDNELIIEWAVEPSSAIRGSFFIGNY